MTDSAMAVVAVADRPDGRSSADLVDPVGVEHGRVLLGFKES